MGVVRTIKGEDGRPYISLEDLIREIEAVKKNNDEEDQHIIDDRPNFFDVVLTTLSQMEKEYYDKFLFRKKDK